MRWQDENEGPNWLPVLNETEADIGLPQDLLARVACQESSFRPGVISGAEASATGALGLMQLEPEFFESVRRPVPYTRQDTLDQIREAAEELRRLYSAFRDWGFTLAAYDWGAHHVEEFQHGQLRVMPAETTRYVREILSDVPLPTRIRL